MKGELLWACLVLRNKMRICEKKTKEGFHVTWVDMSPESSKITNEDLNPEDHVHPVASGWEKFAITIYNTIKSTMTELSK